MRSFLAITVFLFSGYLFADEITDLAKAKCVKCHSDGAAFISLGAQQPEYLAAALKAYQTGARHSDQSNQLMAKRVKGLDEKTLAGLANFFNKTSAPTPASGDPTLRAKGKAIYETGVASSSVPACVTCHGQDGEGRGGGNGLNPRLAGQTASIFLEQIENYKTGKYDNQKVMTDIANKLTADEAKAIAVYMQSR